MPGYHHDPKGSEETNTVGALANGFANSAINDTEVEDGSTGYVGGVANGDDRNNTDTDIDVDARLDVAAGNGDNRDNSYDWDYDSKSYSDNDTITDIKTDYDWDYDSKTDIDTDIKTTTDSFNTDVDTEIAVDIADSFNADDSDFGTIKDVSDVGNLGVAGEDLSFDIGDDFSFSMDVDDILNDSLNGAGNDSGFSAVQANYLADQDSAWELKMENGGANNQLSANAAEAHGNEGIDMDGKFWDVKADDDVTGSSVADSSAILANSGYHMEVVQGANLQGNTIDSTVVGGNSHITDAGQDLDG